MQGHFNYYAVPRNQRKLGAFKYQVYRLWLRTLRQRSQRHRMTGERMNRLADRWFPLFVFCTRTPNSDCAS